MTDVDRTSAIVDPAVRLAAQIVDWAILTPASFFLCAALACRSNAIATTLCVSGALYLAGVLVVNARLVHRHGQSIGKRFCRLRVLYVDGRRMGLGRIVFVRNVVPVLIGSVPFVGLAFVLLDSLFIFGAARRTLHDRIASSIVVRAGVHVHPPVRQET